MQQKQFILVLLEALVEGHRSTTLAFELDIKHVFSIRNAKDFELNI